MRERGFTAGQAARLCGVKYRTVDYWSRSGFLEASISEAYGKGTRRVYSFADVVSLRVARELRRLGVSLQGLRLVQARLRTYRHLEHPLAGSRLVVIPGTRIDVARVEITDDNARLESLLSMPGQQIAPAVVLNLAGVVGDVVAHVVELDEARDAKKARAARKQSTRKARARAGIKRRATAR